MTDLIDPNELIGPPEVAEIIGLSNRRGVSVYRRRAGFPAPVVERAQCVLWRRSDVEVWADARLHHRRLVNEPLYRQGFEHARAGGKATDNPLGPSDPAGAPWSDGWRRGSSEIPDEVAKAMADYIGKATGKPSRNNRS